MAELSYAEQKKSVVKGLLFLGGVTIFEVAFALFAKGHIVESIVFTGVLHYLYMFTMAALSLIKAYYIVYFFMHMKYEVPGLRVSVLLPMLLLVWAIVAFFQEGGSWGERRELIKEKNAEKSEESIKVQGALFDDRSTLYDQF